MVRVWWRMVHKHLYQRCDSVLSTKFGMDLNLPYLKIEVARNFTT